MPKPLLPDYVPVAEEIIAAEDWLRSYNADIRSAAHRAFSRQLLALCDASTPRRFIDLAQAWEIEALR